MATATIANILLAGLNGGMLVFDLMTHGHLVLIAIHTGCLIVSLCATAFCIARG